MSGLAVRHESLRVSQTARYVGRFPIFIHKRSIDVRSAWYRLDMESVCVPCTVAVEHVTRAYDT
jgi:hypothetical protein